MVKGLGVGVCPGCYGVLGLFEGFRVSGEFRKV